MNKRIKKKKAKQAQQQELEQLEHELAKLSPEQLADINNTISKTFYKDEDDATQFYSDMMSRRKEHGGKYNEKFLDYQPLESEFEDDEEE